MRATLAAVIARWDRVLVAVLIVSAVLLVHSAFVVGPTYDEHFYVATGVLYWSDGDFALNREHPPLLKLLAGLLPSLVGGFGFPAEPAAAFNLPGTFFYQSAGERWRELLVLGRLPLCLLTLASEVCFYLIVRRWTSRRAARVATIAYAFNPNVLAHGCLAALDMGTAALMAMALFAWATALRAPTAGTRLTCGVAVGLACATKFSALVLWPLLLASAVWRAAVERKATPIISFALVLPVALSAFAACYGFDARSVASVRLDPEFADEVAPQAMASSEFAKLVGGAVDQSRFRARLFDVALAQGARSALDVWLLGFASNSATEVGSDALSYDDRRSILAGLTKLGAAPGEVRKRAFEAVLGADDLPEDERVRVFAALSRVDLASSERAGGVDAWRSFYADNGTRSWDVVVFRTGWLQALVHGLFGEHRPVPLLAALKGLDRQFAHASSGHASYYRGVEIAPTAEDSGESYPLYYLDVMLHKNPLTFIAAALVGAILAFRRRAGFGAIEAVLVLSTGATLLVVFASGNTLMGVRYVLPLIPLMAVLVARFALSFPRAAEVCVVVAVLESIWIHPHELMYFNLLAGGPDRGTAITVLGDDWGQDTAALGEWCREHESEIAAAGGLFFDPYLEADPVALGLERTNPILRGVRGLVAVNVVSQRRWASRYAWLEDFPVHARIGWTIRIYDTRTKTRASN